MSLICIITKGQISLFDKKLDTGYIDWRGKNAKPLCVEITDEVVVMEFIG
jgi:hypothetical protein